MLKYFTRNYLVGTFHWQKLRLYLPDVLFCAYCSLSPSRDHWLVGEYFEGPGFSICVHSKWQQVGGYWFFTLLGGSSEDKLMHKVSNLGIKEKCIACHNKIIKIILCFLIAFENFHYIGYLLHLVKFWNVDDSQIKNIKYSWWLIEKVNLYPGSQMRC